MGRLDIKYNKEIKAILLNIDCCGDSLCGKPKNYSNNISKILKRTSCKN